jgi:hypothetical protein
MKRDWRQAVYVVEVLRSGHWIKFTSDTELRDAKTRLSWFRFDPEYRIRRYIPDPQQKGAGK